MTAPGRFRVELARRRAAGEDFDAAWAGAMAGAPCSWRDALEETRGAWAAAFTGAANTTRGDQAVRAIVVLRQSAQADGSGVHGQRGRRRRAVAHEVVA